MIEKGAFGIGTKFFVFFELTGMRVTRGQFTVSAQFLNNTTTVRVEFTEDFTGQIGRAITGAVDHALAAVQQAFNDLEEAIGDYEFELSLRGLRELLPAVATTRSTP